MIGYNDSRRYSELTKLSDTYPGTQNTYTALGSPDRDHGIVAWIASNASSGGLIAQGERCFGDLLPRAVYDSGTNLPGQNFGAENIFDFAIRAPDGNPKIVFVANGNNGAYYGTFEYDCRSGQIRVVKETGDSLPEAPGIQAPIAFAATAVSANNLGIAQVWSYSSPSGNATMAVFFSPSQAAAISSAGKRQNDEDDEAPILVTGSRLFERDGQEVPVAVTVVNTAELARGDDSTVFFDITDNNDGWVRASMDALQLTDNPIVSTQSAFSIDPLNADLFTPVFRAGGPIPLFCQGEFQSLQILGVQSGVDRLILDLGNSHFVEVAKTGESFDGLPIETIFNPSVKCMSNSYSINFGFGSSNNDSYQVQTKMAFGDVNFTLGDNATLVTPPSDLGAVNLFGRDGGRTYLYVDRTNTQERGIIILDFQEGSLLFDDGFESGNTSIWTDTPQSFQSIAPKTADVTQGLALLKPDDDGEIRVRSVNPTDGQLISELRFLNPSWSAFGVYSVPNLSSQGNAGVGVAAVRSPDFLPIIQFKDVVTGALISNVFPLSAGWSLVAIEVVPGAGTNGGPAIAVLAVRDSDGLMVVQLRDIASNQFIRNVFPLGAGWVPMGLGVIENTQGGPSLAVLARRLSDNLTIVQVRLASDASLVRNLYHLGLGWTAVEMQVAPDTNNGVDDVALRMVRDADGLEAIQTRDTLTQALIANHFPFGIDWDTLGFRPVQVNGSPALAVLYSQISTGQMLVQVRDLASRAIVKNTFFLGPPWQPGAFRTLGDISGNQAGELVVLSENPTTGVELFQLRDSLLSDLLRNVPVN